MPENVTPKQVRGIMALLTEPTITGAAKAAGVAPKTIYKWLKLSHFRDALQEAQGQEINAAASRLAGGLGVALEELGKLVTTAESESVRRAAVNDWLSHAVRLQETIALEERVRALEKGMK